MMCSNYLLMTRYQLKLTRNRIIIVIYENNRLESELLMIRFDTYKQIKQICWYLKSLLE